MIRLSLLLFGLLAAAGCASEAPAPANVAAGSMDVGLLDYEIAVAADAVAPGTVAIDVTNAGRDAHDLAVTVGQEKAATPRLAPGEDTSIEVVVPSGAEELRLWCTLPGHQAQGMHITLGIAHGDGPRP